MKAQVDDSPELKKLERRLRNQFVKAFATYHLIEDDDHILIGLSGGKDSLLLTELLAQRSKIQHPRFRVEALHVRMVNVRYESDTTYLEQFCQKFDVPLHIVSTRFDLLSTSPPDNSNSTVLLQSKSILRKQKQPCFLCSWNRRKQLFNLAQQLGCNKLAFGHHQDDILHTALMNLTFQSRFDAMPVRLKLDKMPLTIIRPLCLCRESDIAQYARWRNYKSQIKHCPYEHQSCRTTMANIFNQLENLNPEVRYSLWSALDSEGKL